MLLHRIKSNLPKITRNQSWFFRWLLAKHTLSFVIALGLLLSLGAAALSIFSIRRHENRRFWAESKGVETQIVGAVRRVSRMLYMARAFISSQESPNGDSFRNFLINLSASKLDADTQYTGYAQRITRKGPAPHEQEDWEGASANNQKRLKDLTPTHFPIRFIESRKTGQFNFLDFDLYSNPNFARAMDKARDTGSPALSKEVQMTPDFAGRNLRAFLLFLPIYRKGTSLRTPAERRSALEAFVFTVITAQNFFPNLHKDWPLSGIEIGVKIYEGREENADRLLFSTEYSEKTLGEERLNRLHQISLFSNEWTVRFYALPGFRSPADRYSPYLIFLAGLSVTALMAIALQINRRRFQSIQERAEAEYSARIQLQDLALSLERTAREKDRQVQIQERLFELGQLLSAELDQEKLAQAIIDVSCKIAQATYGAFFYFSDNPGASPPNRQALSESLRAIRSVPAADLPTSALWSEIVKTELSQEALGNSEREKHRSACFPFNQPGYPMVQSYLAVPVISCSKDIVGGIFLGHPDRGIFGVNEEKIVKILASKGAIAIENAKLFHRIREAVDARDEFLSICSHELRTPLTSMKLQNQLVQKTMRQDFASGNITRLEKLVLQNSRQIDRLGRLIEEMLDVAKIRSGKLHISKEPLDLAELVRETADRCAPQLQLANCSLEIVAPHRLETTGDKLRLEQVLTNLLSNAAKYGAGKPVRVELRQETNLMKISVQDQGIGIAPEHQERIFERFERVVAKNEFSGLGLGLYIVKSILDLIGGKITVSSVLGEGARFEVVLPSGSNGASYKQVIGAEMS